MHILSSNNNEKQKFKILALDGGGIRGVVTACILKEVREQVGKPLNQYFDLITGTSTGSILAASLVIGKEPEDLIEIYEKRGREIFNSFWFQKLLSWVWGAKYPNEGLIKVLRKELGEITLHQISDNTSTELLIFAYDTLHRNTTFFTNKCEDNRWYKNIPLWEICACSASAPTFFPPYELKWTDVKDPHKKEWSFPHVDGGLSANCPALAALGHVMQVKKKRLEDISILSIGTGRTTQPIKYEWMKKWGKLWWGKNVPDVFMGGQIQLATDTCQQILNSVNPNGYLRLEFSLNQALGKRTNDYSPTPILPKNERTNKFIQEKIEEEMDNTNSRNIKKLINAAEKFAKLESKNLKDFIKNQQLLEV